jgi:hypothetical protein
VIYVEYDIPREVSDMARVVHFEIVCDDPERASAFYTEVFGWKITKWEGPLEYWLASTGEKGTPGIDGALMRREGPVGGVVNTVGVPSFDEYAKKITAAGGKALTPKTAVPRVGYFAYFKDTEGNTFGVMENDENAS